jgi:putative transposase
MPRKLLEVSNYLPYHVTARTNRREPFSIPLNQVWTTLGRECLFLRTVYEVEFQALVLMPNHFHMILTVPKHDLGKAMHEFMKSVSKRINLISGQTGHVFGGPYHWSIIKNSRYYGHALKYVYRNPVKARLYENVEDSPYSTLHGLLGKSHLPFPIHHTQVGMELALPTLDSYDQLAWLNKPFPTEAEHLIQKRLRRRVFDTIIDPKNRRPYQPLEELL